MSRRNHQPIASSIPDSSATLQVPSTITQEQNRQIFELTRRKHEVELATAEEDAKQRRVTVEEESMLRRELMVKESKACVAAAASATIAPPPRKIVMEDDDIIGEVPQEVINITLRFAGLSQEEIIRIFHNKFKPINLYRLRHMRGLRFDTFQEQERIGIEYGMLRLRKTSVTYKDFGKSIHEVWSEAFHNYTTILVSLFEKEAPDLHNTLAELHSNIYELSTVYEWQDAVLLMAIEAHSYIVAQKPIDLLRWVISAKFQGRFCKARTLIGMRATITDNKRKRSKSTPGRRVKSFSGPNNPSVTYDLINKGDCN